MDNISIKTVSQYLDAIEKIRQGWGLGQPRGRKWRHSLPEPLWYRGMKSIVQTLEPKLLRDLDLYCREDPICPSAAKCKGKCVKVIERAEKRLITLFKNRGRIEISQAEAIMIRGVKSRPADLHYMFRIQHYGGDTRLLDWTANPLNGLYFALRYDDGDQVEFEEPSVWVLSPLNLLSEQAKMAYALEKLKMSPEDKPELDTIPTADDPLVEMFLARPSNALVVRAKHNKLMGQLAFIKYPIPLMPALDEERIRSQQGRFTLHLKVPGWHPPQGIPKILTRIPIRVDQKERASILRELNRIGINEFSLFPDLGGLARHCRHVRFIWLEPAEETPHI